MICGLTTKNLNRTFQGLAAKFLETGTGVKALKEHFAEKTGDSTRFPSDADLRKGFLETNAYHSIKPRPRLMDILWELEKASRSNLAEKTTTPPSLWIEHVMPQNWTEEWPFDDGLNRALSDETPEVLSRNHTLNSFGNLSLTSDALNISAGNKSFSKKKEKFRKNSGLFLNKWFLEKSSWTEVDILERGEHLAELASSIWKPL